MSFFKWYLWVAFVFCVAMAIVIGVSNTLPILGSLIAKWVGVGMLLVSSSLFGYLALIESFPKKK